MRRFASALAFLILLTACGKSEPLTMRKDYVGLWTAPGLTLQIAADGGVDYKRSTNGSNVSLDAPIQKFEGNNFVVGIGPFGTTFKVSQPPHKVGDAWKMTVDGVELTRSENGTLPPEQDDEDDDKGTVGA